MSVMTVRGPLCCVFGILLALQGIGLAPGAVPPAGIVVVANADTPMLTEQVLQKIYLGKVVEIDGRPVVPVNLVKGARLRKEFMSQVLSQDDEKFVAYWTVRRYIGKGSPPREFDSMESQLEYLRNTPGAVGYVDASADIKGNLKTLMKRP